MTVLVSVMATAGPSLADLPLEVLETVIVLLDWRTLRAMSTVRLLAAEQSFIKQLQVSVKLRSISHSVAKTKCCSFIPSDIFIEIWEELGCEDDINFLKVSNLNPAMNMSGADSQLFRSGRVGVNLN